MEMARKIRVTEGKHVIPVPTFELKKNFSGYLLDPLQIFKSKGRGQKPYISEKSIIRPTFSYLGNFTISDTVFRQIIEYLATKMSFIHKVSRVRIDGCDIISRTKEFKDKVIKEIENLTSMNVESIDILIKGIYVPEEGQNNENN
jgi:hypothetical protein